MMNCFNSKNIKLSLQQPSIPIYRKAFFEKLNEQLSLTLFYGFDGVRSDLNINIEKFYFPLRIISLGVFNLKWHPAQLKAVSSKYNAVILSWDIQYISLWLALIKGKIINVPIILWGHGYSKKDNKLKKFLRNLPAYFVDALILYDYHTAEYLSGTKKNKSKIFTAPNSLDQSIIEEAKEFWNHNKEGLLNFQIQNSIDNSFNLIYIGRIYMENQLEILFKAFKLAHAEISSSKLIIIGDYENDYANKLKSLVIELGIEKYIVWAGGIYDELKIAPWMMSSKIFCYPANMGLSLMHAFGYGLPVITNNSFNSHGPEVWALVDGVNGLTFQNQDYKELAAKIVELCKNENLRSELSSNALKTVQEDYNINKMISGFISAINFVMKK